jgi:hypothetical protein
MRAVSVDEARPDAKNAVYRALTELYNYLGITPSERVFQSGAYGKPTTSQDLLWWGAVRNTAGGGEKTRESASVRAPQNPLDPSIPPGVASHYFDVFRGGVIPSHP